MKRTIKTIAIVSSLATLAGCAWWQNNKGKINCAVITTVENAPALIGIVTTCAAVATNVAAVLPCIEGAAGSEWAADVVACFAGDVAGLTSCPAARGTLRAAPVDAGAQAKLRAAVQAKYGDSFAVGGGGQ
jgi:hypothetical protein